MDRNSKKLNSTARPNVALRKESVDRNNEKALLRTDSKTSLSARRAWIEIFRRARIKSAHRCVALRKESVDRNAACAKIGPSGLRVALRKESVDRNEFNCLYAAKALLSLSARRAWIEI